MKKLIILIIGFMVFLSLRTEAFACTCLEYRTPACAAVSRADAVFTGTVEKITPLTDQDNEKLPFSGVGSISSRGGSGLVWVHVKVDRSFKNMPDREVKVLATQGTSCDLGIEAGEKWIFYAARNAKGSLGVGPCGSTEQIGVNSTEYLESLAQVTKDPHIESINGIVHLDGTGDVGIDKSKINVTGKNFSRSFVTDKNGFFKVAVPHPGSYKVRVTVPLSAFIEVPFNLHKRIVQMSIPTKTASTFSYRIEVLPKQCQYAELNYFEVDLSDSAEISGKIASSGGRDFPKSLPQLCQLKETEQETLDSRSLPYEVKKDGTFTFAGLHQGKYVIVENLQNFPEVSAPYPRLYYPGIKNFKDARIINLRMSQELKGLTFKLPAPLPTRQITGQLFWKDKTPITFTSNTAFGQIPDVDLYNPQSVSPRLDSEYYKTWSRKEGEAEKVKTVAVMPDGKFTIVGFDGFEYFLRGYVRDKDNNEHCGFAKITVNETLKPLEIILDRTEKCWAADYVKEKK